MPASRTAAALELGEALKSHRAKAGLTLRALELKVGISNTMLSFWENGHRLPKDHQLADVLVALEVDNDEQQRLMAMRHAAEGPGVLVAGPTTIGAQLSMLIEQEEKARKITEISPLLVPGLLQTADYAHAVLRRHPDVDLRVRLRRGRQEILTRAQNPVEFHALISIDVLTSHHIAPPRAMAEQMKHLLAMMERPNITIRLVESTDDGYTPMLAGPFILLEFDTAPPEVHLEHYSASASLWDEEDVRSFTAAVEEINETAMTPHRTCEVINEFIEGMEKT
jgi:transcriptional regulator with XRE-family HTH domain